MASDIRVTMPTEALEELEEQKTRMEGQLNQLLDTVHNQSTAIQKLKASLAIQKECGEDCQSQKGQSSGQNQVSSGGFFQRIFPTKDEIIEKLKTECAELKKNISSCQQENNKLHKELKTCKTDCANQSRKLKEAESWKTEIYALKNSKMKLEKELNAWKERCLRAEKKLEEKKRKKAVIKAYCSMKSSITNQILPEMTAQVQSIINEDSTCIELIVEQVMTPEDVRTSAPLLVFCVNATRLGTDVDSSLQFVENKPETMVIILHHKDSHALPSQPSDKLLIRQSYQMLAGITDMAFTSAKGLYICEMNNRAIRNIANFIVQKT